MPCCSARLPYERVVVENDSTKVKLLPSDPSLAGAEVELVNLPAREYRLQRVLQTINGDYDYVLIDCPPSLGLADGQRADGRP